MMFADGIEVRRTLRLSADEALDVGSVETINAIGMTYRRSSRKSRNFLAASLIES